MLQFLYRIQPIRLGMLTEGPTELESKIVNEHFEYLEGLVNEEVVLMAGRTLHADESAFGIVIFVAESDIQAKEIVHNDPAVLRGVMRAELFPYRIALWSKKGPSDPVN
ncbi:hypothetical protein KIH39_08960 [Telmatocola sphagniphila]|uniref:YCII-related domain-containing protein n=1 Tax=Telmatocola sphagniphila TaxID=1123043 RepID=A0A8E6B8U5_9BACT|nr:YciI family protein [Telmatocola sphagniphila]QVL34018.1 hypothetical protein KIH39_08960 [Telmatocola sphagniphila]